MPEYFSPPPDYITTYNDVLGSPVLSTALLTLTILSSWRSSPAPPLLACTKASMGQDHYCTAR